MKSLLFCFNVIFCVCAIALIAIGGIIQWHIKNSVDSDHSFNTVSIVIIAVGCVAFFIAFLGCWGVINDSKCMLITYALFVILILIVEFACGLSLLLFSREDINKEIKKTLDAALEEYNKDSNADKSTNTLNGIQASLRCCGVNGKQDFITVSNIGSNFGLPPDSCKCIDKDSDECLLGFYKANCSDKLSDLLETLKHSFGTVAILSAVFEIVLVLFACVLAHRRHENNFA